MGVRAQVDHGTILPELTSAGRAATMRVMGGHTAEEAVYELLGQPARPHALVGAGRRGVARPVQNRPWKADLGTLDFLKEREVLGRRLFVVAFEAEHVRRGPTQMTMLVRADRVGKTWLARRITGASGSGDLPASAPRVNLGGSWGAHGFCGGGRVDPNGTDVARVRIRFANGVELEDDTDGGWVLFFTDQPVARPNAEVELLDSHDQVVSRFDWPWAPDLPDVLRRRIRR
jgi:hypothetical protein